MTDCVRPPLRASSGVEVGAPSCARGGEMLSGAPSSWGTRRSPTQLSGPGPLPAPRALAALHALGLGVHLRGLPVSV